MEGLCHYCNFLWIKCKKLWTGEWIEVFWVNNGLIKLRIEPEGAASRILRTQDLHKLLPDYNF